MTEFRWALADSGEPGLFAPEDVLLPDLGRGRMSDLEFLHVTAKRVLNRVPPGSRAPFPWTINVYRGCSHACTYCLSGDTPILMADGTSRPLGSVRPGDRVYGTSVDGGQRRYVETSVLDHWQTFERAYLVTLDDDTALVASGEHRLLTDAGWREARDLGGATLLGDPPSVSSSARGARPHRVGTRARVRSVEDLGCELPMVDITTGTGDFVANGVVSHNCFARPTHEYLGLNLGEDFDRKIVVKINAIERVRAELAAPTWQHEPVAMGTNTDPYQRAEAKYRLTRGVVRALVEHDNRFSILTKSPLVTRDLDVITEADATVNFSIATLDERVWRMSEPGTPHPRRRLDAMRRMSEAGIATGALIAPILPALSDGTEQLREVAAAITEAGGRILGIGVLGLRPGVREHFLAWLADAAPDLHAGYLRRYADTVGPPERYVADLYRRAGVERLSDARYRG